MFNLNVYLYLDRKVVCEVGEVFFFKKEKVGCNVGELNGILGIVLNVDGKIELLFVMNLFVENGEDGFEFGYCGFIVGCVWLMGKWLF